jgi:hypothetical protein
VVRIITAGKGVDLTWTNYGPDPDNPEAGESVTVKTAGSVMKTVNNPDGTQTSGGLSAIPGTAGVPSQIVGVLGLRHVTAVGSQPELQADDKQVCRCGGEPDEPRDSPRTEL